MIHMILYITYFAWHWLRLQWWLGLIYKTAATTSLSPCHTMDCGYLWLMPQESVQHVLFSACCSFETQSSIKQTVSALNRVEWSCPTVGRRRNEAMNAKIILAFPKKKDGISTTMGVRSPRLYRQICVGRVQDRIVATTQDWWNLPGLS